VKKDTHIIFGRDPFGKVRGFTRIGSADDVLEWFGINAAPYYAREYLNGNISLQRWAVESLKSPVNKLVSGLTPIVKIPGELIGGTAWFPDVFQARKIRDRYEYIAREFGVLNLYKRAMGKPVPPVTLSVEAALDMITYKWEPKQTHYNAFRYDKVPDWRAANGLGSSGGYSESAASEALYLIREAIRYDNEQALVRGLSDYKNAGGTRANLGKMIDRLHPLAALKPSERKEFMDSLDAQESRQLDQAIEFYEEHFGSRKAEIDMAARTEMLPEKRERKRGKK
jgi:hypothetical protein